MKKGEILEGIITGYDFPNKAYLNMPKNSETNETIKVVVKGALLGQKVRFMVTKKKSGLAEGRLLDVLEASPLEDGDEQCPYFGMCGGCSYQSMSYENQLKLKGDMVRKLIDKYVDDASWEGVLPAPLRFNYRNKMEFTFGDEYKDGPLALGMHKKGGHYDILNVPECKIINSDWGKIITATKDFFAAKNVPFYHKMKHEGVLRNLVVRQTKVEGEFLINLVASTQWEKYGVRFESDEYVACLREVEKSFEHGHIAGILYTENDSLGDVVQSDKTYVLDGKDYIEEEILGLRFKISPFSFFQTNSKGCEVLYEKAREYIMSGQTLNSDNSISKDDGKIVFDLYSGTGTIAQMMAPSAKKVIGIEIVEEAVEAAKENAKLNGLDNCEFIAGDVLKAIDLVEDKPDLIILDPPRDGINPKALEKILAFNVDEMIYISCKPTSLARDLETICANGYKVVRACAVDEFPATVHVETVVLMSKKEK